MDRVSPRLTTALVLFLAAPVLATPGPAAASETSTFGTSTPVFLGDPFYVGENTTDIVMPPGTSSGPMSPYPSTITVPRHGIVQDVNVNLLGIASSFPGDLNVLLVGPHGQQSFLMSDVGAGNAISNVSVNINDEADSFFGDGTITSTSYKPTNQGVDSDSFPDPAPPVSGNTPLSIFDGTEVAGVWSLYAFDDQSSDVSSMMGWELQFSLQSAPYPSTVEVAGMPSISDVDVKLDNFTAQSLSDVHLLLVGPGGQQSYLMGDLGVGGTASNLDVTFDDEAPTPFPSSGGVGPGAYRPTTNSIKTFPAPAPVASGDSPLSAFDGLDPDGQWRLFTFDDSGLKYADIDGWSLVFTWEDTVVPTGHVTISGGAASTRSTAVTVALSATDPQPGTGVSAMRLSNDGVAFSPYQPYAANAPWTLPGGDGVKRVYAQFKDGAGNESAIVSDTIRLDTVGPSAAKLTPPKNATGVSRSVKVKVKASEALLKSSVSTKTAFVKKKGSTIKVPAAVTYDAATRTIVIAPSSPLRRHTTYVVTVKGIKDLAANQWDQKPSISGHQSLASAFTTA